MNYASIVNKDNDEKVYLCKLTDGRTLELQVHNISVYPNTEVFALYNFEDSDDTKEYLE